MSLVLLCYMNVYIPGYQNTEYKAAVVWYYALSTCGATYLIVCHCLSRLDLKILRVVAATGIPESEFQSCSILWLNTFLWISSLLWNISSLSWCPLVHRPSALRRNNSGSSWSSPFMILYTWIMSPRWRLESSDCSLRACSLSSYGKCFRWGINLVAHLWIFSISSLSIRCRGCHIIFPY